MTKILKIKKKQKKLNFSTAARLAHTLAIRELTKLIGNLVASIEAILYGRRFYRQLEKEVKLNILHRRKVILKQRLHFQISPKKNSLIRGKIIL